MFIDFTPDAIHPLAGTPEKPKSLSLSQNLDWGTVWREQLAPLGTLIRKVVGSEEGSPPVYTTQALGEEGNPPDPEPPKPSPPGEVPDDGIVTTLALGEEGGG